MYSRGYLREHSSVLAFVMRLLDSSCILLGAWLSFALTSATTDPVTTQIYAHAAIIVTLLAALIFPMAGAYQTWRGRSLLEEVRTILSTLVGVFVLIGPIWFFAYPSGQLSREWILLWLLIAASALALSRLVLRKTLHTLRARGHNSRNIVVIGEGVTSEKILDKLTAANHYGFNIVGLFTANGHSPNVIPTHILTIGDLKDAFAFIKTHAVDQIWIALPTAEANKIENILNNLADQACDIRLIPDIFGLHLINHSISEVAGIPLVNLSVTPLEGANRFIKTLEDKVLATLALAMVSPLMLCIAVLIKLDSPGPVIFKQRRYGLNNEIIDVWKFRTMSVCEDDDNTIVQAKRNDIRVTRLGTILRKTSLDELPQLINVILHGTMSLVGPRPHAIAHNEYYKNEIPSYMKRHIVKPGITGLAQVNGYRGEIDAPEKMTKRVEYDLKYIEQWSVWLDIKIIFLTIARGFINKNAY